MHVPRFWAKAKGEVERHGERQPLAVWGWGDDEGGARATAAQRLARLIERFQGGAREPGAYDYGERPLREELVQTLEPGALLTRNRYGAIVLNTERLLFLDVDLPPASGLGLFGRLFGKRAPADVALERLRDALHTAAPAASFRLYRTAAGLRVLATDREFDPQASETTALMEATGTDPCFARLCRAQHSFRARLTPKPWRCACPNPPGEYPRSDEETRERFSAWCQRYERAIEGHATCRYLENVGAGTLAPRWRTLVELHDQVTRCQDDLPLA